MFKSNKFGRIFWVDDELEFKSCPLCVDETVTRDFDNVGMKLQSIFDNTLVDYTKYAQEEDN